MRVFDLASSFKETCLGACMLGPPSIFLFNDHKIRFKGHI